MSVRPWHAGTAEQVLDRLGTSTSGLDAEGVGKRLERHGPNVIEGRRGRTFAAMLLAQFADFMIVVLLAAALISGIIGEVADTVAILVIVLLNAAVGAVQEFRAERAVATLKEMSAPEARVLRNGEVVALPAAELVPGDIVLLEAGNIVPADLRLISRAPLQVDESLLTGESHPVDKEDAILDQDDLPLGDRRNLVFKSSLVTRGSGRGVVVATGADTEIGRIAALLEEAEGARTPLQLRLLRFGRYLALAVLAICAVVFAAGLLQGQPALLMFLTAVSMAVAAIPEALPAVVTVSLAFGARKLIRHNALVRKLPAVETLGSVTFICADKTGTLTRNRMTAERFYYDGELHEALADPSLPGAGAELGRAMALNNDVRMVDAAPAGEPTELALFEAAHAAGYDREALDEELARVATIAFDSDRKRMSTVHRDGKRTVVYVKGAPERVLPHCIGEFGAGDSFDARSMIEQADRLAAQGYRVLAYACRENIDVDRAIDAERVEHELSFLGLVALIDPPRPEAGASVADCISAGITPVMITGDHPGTAFAIAQRIGIAENERNLITGSGLQSLSDEKLADVVADFRVYARVSPEQKLRIVRALQQRQEFVAMTGDGVNDAPALKRADIGIAMGRKGTDVAREAADMVLLDDDFSTIVRAVREGRRVFDNIRKFIKYTMTSNSGEIWTLFLAPFIGLPIPLLPIHILWINLVTDGLPGLAFTAEPSEERIMKRAPRPPQESIFAHGMWQHIVWVGLFIGGISLASQAFAVSRGTEYWQTVVFTVLTLAQLFHSLAVRSERESLLRMGLFSNKPMAGAVVITVMLQLAVIYLPALNGVFKTAPLPVVDLLLCFAVASSVLVVVEIEKWLFRRGLIYTTSVRI